MDKAKFEAAYESIVNQDYSAEDTIKKRLLKFGGKGKLQKMLDNDEKILAVSFAMSVDDPAVVAVFLSDDVLVITDRRFIYLQKRLFGTVVKEIPLKVVRGVSWRGKGNTLNLSTFNEQINMYINDRSLQKIKNTIYTLLDED